MSFSRGPKPSPAPELPNPADAANQQQTSRRRRLASGGMRSTFLGSAMQASLPPPSITGVK